MLLLLCYNCPPRRRLEEVKSSRTSESHIALLPLNVGCPQADKSFNLLRWIVSHKGILKGLLYTFPINTFKVHGGSDVLGYIVVCIRNMCQPPDVFDILHLIFVKNCTNLKSLGRPLENYLLKYAVLNSQSIVA